MQPLTVTELNLAVKNALEPHFKSIAVKGEVSNLKVQSSGHVYFSLKDSTSQLSAVLFKGNATKLPRPLKDGDQLIAIGELSLYAPRGQYQLVVREVQFFGVGELLLKLHQLKGELQARGWFAPEQKKKLPRLPKRIGVVTSPTGAVIQDILNVLRRRFEGVQVLLNPVKVQGEGAAEEIAAAIDEFNRYELADVLIVGRGGGSIEDLWAFNEEIVAKAIFASKIPIISAVGHETDTTISDWVADMRAPTPSAAAELVIVGKAQLLDFLDHSARHVRQKVMAQSSAARQKWNSLQKHPFLHQPKKWIEPLWQGIDLKQSQIDAQMRHKLNEKGVQIRSAAKQAALLTPAARLAQLKKMLASYREQLLPSMQGILGRRKERAQRLAGHLSSLNPRNVLKKGYSILFQQNTKSIVFSAKDLAPEQKVSILMHDGRVDAVVSQPTSSV